MTKSFFTAILVFFTATVFAQNLTLDQIISLRVKSLGDVEEFLTSHNWELVTGQDESKEILGAVRFAYKKSGDEDKAESFIKYVYSNTDIGMNRISIQTYALNKYNIFMSRLKALGYKLKYSKVKNGGIVKVYKGKGIAVEVSSEPFKSDYRTSTAYSFFICDVGLYYLQYE